MKLLKGRQKILQSKSIIWIVINSQDQVVPTQQLYCGCLNLLLKIHLSMKRIGNCESGLSKRVVAWMHVTTDSGKSYSNIRLSDKNKPLRIEESCVNPYHVVTQFILLSSLFSRSVLVIFEEAHKGRNKDDSVDSCIFWQDPSLQAIEERTL